MKKGLFLMAVSFLLMGTLAGCGRVSKPEQPKGSFYPHTYIVKQSEPDGAAK